MSGNTLLLVGLAGCAGLVAVTLVVSRLLKTEPPPPPPPPPPPAQTTVTGMLRFTEGYFRANLDDDVKRYGTAPVELAALARPLAYSEELERPQTLKADRGTLETPHLKLATHIIKEWAVTESGQRFRFEHMVLDITNKGDQPIAYRVQTSVPKQEKCRSKAHMQHNAIALKPGETASRTECLWNPGMTVTVNAIEVLELPELGYHYVSNLPPSQIGLDERTAEGHTPPKGGRPCKFVPWRDIQAAKATWADVVDFYARHNCETYSYFRGYTRWTAPGALPAKPTAPPQVAAGAPPEQPTP